jgi:hypothetical protein
MSGVIQEGHEGSQDALVGGISRKITSASITHGFKQLVAVGHFESDPADGRPVPGTEIRLRFALDRISPLQTVFTGEVDSDTSNYAPWTVEVQASGILARCREALGTADIDNGDGTFTPAISYDSQTRGAIITDLLSRYGITRVNIADSGETIATVNTIYLESNQPALDLIQQLDEDEGYITFEGPDGTVFRIAVTGIPSGGAARTWVEGADIYTGQLTETREGTINRVTATGQPQTGTTGLDFTPTATRDAPSPYIPNPPGYRALERNSNYFESFDQCDAYCARKLGELNRLRGEVPFALALPDLGLRAGMTVALTSAKLDSLGSFRYYVQEVTHSFDGSGINTSGVLLLASAGAGYSANQHPVAAIDLHQETETLADGTQLTTVSVDGAGSYDPDGDGGIYNGIVSYVWSGTATDHSVVPGSGGQKATYAISGDPTGLTVILTVTDVDGATGVTTRTLGSADTPVVTRDLWSAEGTDLAFTADGGATWTDAGVAAVVIPRVAAEDFQLAATSAGALYHIVVADDLTLTATAISSPTGVTALSINTFAGSSRCWAGTSSGGIWQSLDSGATWSQVGTLPNAASVKRIEESPFANGDLTALAGNIAYHSYSAGAAWDVLYTAPVGWTVKDFVSGFADGFLALDGTLATGEPSRIQERNGNVVGDWNQAGPDPVDSPGAHPVALTLGVGAPVLVAVGTAPDDTPQTWWADASGDFTFARGVWDGTTYGNPNDVIRDGQIDGLLYCAADNSLVKTTDFFQATKYELKALAAGRTGHMIGYGKLRAGAISLTIVTDATVDRAYDLWNGTSDDTPPAGWSAVEYNDSAWALAEQVVDASYVSTTYNGGGGPDAPGVWTTTHQDTAGQEVLIRRTFTVPAGQARHATLTVLTNDISQEIWLNGTRVGGNPSDTTTVGSAPIAIDVTANVLPGATNVLAVKGRDVVAAAAGHPEGAFIVFRLEIS